MGARRRNAENVFFFLPPRLLETEGFQEQITAATTADSERWRDVHEAIRLLREAGVSKGVRGDERLENTFADSLASLIEFPLALAASRPCRPSSTRRCSPVQKLLVGQDLLQPAGVLQLEGEHGGGGVVGEHLDDAGGERQRHLACDLHDAPVGRSQAGPYKLHLTSRS